MPKQDTEPYNERKFVHANASHSQTKILIDPFLLEKIYSCTSRILKLIKTIILTLDVQNQSQISIRLTA